PSAQFGVAGRSNDQFGKAIPVEVSDVGHRRSKILDFEIFTEPKDLVAVDASENVDDSTGPAFLKVILRVITMGLTHCHVRKPISVRVSYSGKSDSEICACFLACNLPEEVAVFPGKKGRSSAGGLGEWSTAGLPYEQINEPVAIHVSSIDEMKRGGTIIWSDNTNLLEDLSRCRTEDRYVLPTISPNVDDSVPIQVLKGGYRASKPVPNR